MSLMELVVYLLKAGAALLPTQSIIDDQLTTPDFVLEPKPNVTMGRPVSGFKYVYLGADHRLVTTRNKGDHQLEIAASPLCSLHGLHVAADVIARLTQHMPGSMFQDLTRGSVGIFTSGEKLTIYPEMQSLANLDCGTSCLGTCSRTCSFDGRKYEDMAGLTNSRSVVLEEMVLCTHPHPVALNILVHEMAHLVYNYAIPSAIRHQLIHAYNAAVLNSTWDLASYAMANEREYWAVATVAFFGVTSEVSATTGGMNQCGAEVCSSVHLARDHLRTRDPVLFSVLTNVFTNYNATLDPRIALCPASAFGGS